MKRHKPLLRRTPLKRGSSQLKRTPLRRVSKKRRKESAQYGTKRRAFLEANPCCQAWAIIWPLSDDPAPMSTDVHHRAKRTGGNYLDESTWLAVSRQAHEWIHAHANEARELGLLV